MNGDVLKLVTGVRAELQRLVKEPADGVHPALAEQPADEKADRGGGAEDPRS